MDPRRAARTLQLRRGRIATVLAVLVALTGAGLALRPRPHHGFSPREVELLAWERGFEDTTRSMLGSSVNVLGGSNEGTACFLADVRGFERDLAAHTAKENDCAVCTWLTTPQMNVPQTMEATSRALAQSTWALCGKIAGDAELPAAGGPLLSSVRAGACARCNPE